MTFDEYFNTMDTKYFTKAWKEYIHEAFTAGYSQGLQDAAKNMTDAINKYNFRDSTKLDLITSTKKITSAEVIYPPNGEFYNVLIIFNRFLTHKEQDQIENIVKYWGAIPYCGEYLGGIWYNHYTLDISQDITKSTSDDWGGRNVLELLLDYLQNGTPIRTSNRAGDKTKGTRAINGLGNIIEKIEAF